MPADFAALLPDAARLLRGEPTRIEAGGDTWRYGSHGSLAVHVVRRVAPGTTSRRTRDAVSWPWCSTSTAATRPAPCATCQTRA